MSYTVLQTRIHHDCAGWWSGAVVVDLKRNDGVEGAVWVEAGVPPSRTGTAQAVGVTGLQTAWLFGDSRDAWCPESFIKDDPDEILAVAGPVALQAWNDFLKLSNYQTAQ